MVHRVSKKNGRPGSALSQGKKTSIRVHPAPGKAKERVRMAQKKKQVRTVAGHVFVGNLDPRSTESDLQQIFDAFGEITELSIRVVRGEVGKPSTLTDRIAIENTRIYAAICYKNFISAQAALTMNRVDYLGRRLAVSRNVADLPEHKEIVGRERDRINGKQNKGSMAKRAWSALRRLTVERTLIIEENQAFPDRGLLPAAVEAQKRAQIASRMVPFQMVTRSQTRARQT